MPDVMAAEKWHKMASEANLCYNRDIEILFAPAVLEHPGADDKKGTLVMPHMIPSRLSSRKKYSKLERFLSHVVVQENGCWLWMGAKYQERQWEYGLFPDENGINRRAHRWSYEYFVGPIPKGLQLDHLCRNTLCVHPEHVEPVTNRENTTRGERATLNGQKTSKYVGVRWRPEVGKWQADIQIQGKCYYLGRFADEQDAAQAYKTAQINYETYGKIPEGLRTRLRLRGGGHHG